LCINKELSYLLATGWAITWHSPKVILLANYSELPGTSDFVQLIPTETRGFCEFASSIKSEQEPAPHR
jgi:hypothetical protein